MIRQFASMVSVASYIPNRCLDNNFFSAFLDTNDEWIEQRTGIKTRYFATSESTSDMGTKAGELAISRAKIDRSKIDLVLCATLSPDFYGMPSTACIIADKLGLKDVPAFDISAACTGFIYLLSMAKAYIESGIYENILIIGAEKISSVLDFTDRSTCVLFGDGAGAAVISRGKKEGIKDVHISSNGEYANLLYTPCVINDNNPLRNECLDSKILESSSLESIKKQNQELLAHSTQGSLAKNKNQFLRMEGNKIFKLAVKTIANDAKYILDKNSLTHEQIDYFIPHQANLRIIKSVAKELDISDNKVIVTVQDFGNTSAASIPMAIDYGFRNARFKSRDLLLLDAFGGGLTWGSALVYVDFVE